MILEGTTLICSHISGVNSSPRIRSATAISVCVNSAVMVIISFIAYFFELSVCFKKLLSLRTERLLMSSATGTFSPTRRFQRSFFVFLLIIDEGRRVVSQFCNRRLNAQGFTKTWYMSVPRYAMLHIVSRFGGTPAR